MQRLLTNWAASTDVVLDNLTGTDARGLSWLAGLLLETTPTTAGSVDFSEQDVVDAVSIGLPLMYNPDAPAPASTQELNAYLAAKALVKGLHQAPNIAQAIWPAQNRDNQTVNVQTGVTSAQFSGNFKLAIRAKIQAALDLIMDDVVSFIAFTRNGVFSGPNELIFDPSTTHLDQGLRTYAISTLLARQNYTGVFFAADHTIATPISSCSDQFSCFPTPNTILNSLGYVGNFSAIYNGPFTEASYALQAPSSPAAIRVEPDWGDLELLMDGGLLCHASGNDPSNVVTVRPGQGPDFNCVSRLNFCYTSAAGCPAILRTGTNNCQIPPCGPE